MRALALAALATAACNAVLGLDPVGRGDGGGPAVDGAVDASCVGDLDCDGFADDIDDCPTVANPDQHDEDADTRGDACDNCPARANLDQADTTEVAAGASADGVGDVCDPHPTTGDRLVAFYAMAADDGQWQFTDTNTSFAGDALVFSGVGTGKRVAFHPAPRDASEQVHVVAGVLIETIGVADGGDPDRGVGLHLAAGAADVAGRRCNWLAPVTGLGSPTLAATDAAGLTIASVGTEPMVEGATVVIQGHQRRGAAQAATRCWVKSSSWASEHDTASPSGGLLTTGAFGVVDYRLAMRVLWIAYFDET